MISLLVEGDRECCSRYWTWTYHGPGCDSTTQLPVKSEVQDALTQTVSSAVHYEKSRVEEDQRSKEER